MKCIICGKTNFISKYPQLNIIECKNCEHIFWDYSKKSLNPESIYSIEYFFGNEYSNYLQDRPIIEKNFKQKAKKVFSFKRSGTLLEIGSAFGFFLKLVSDNFDVLGFEICKEATSFAKSLLNITVTSQNFLEYQPTNLFDVICMWDVIEHLVNPDIYLEKISSLTKSGGYIFISTGDISSLIARLRKSKWRLIHPPSHIHYFSKSSLSSLLKKNGFKILDISYPGTWRSLHQLISSVFNIKNAYKYIPGAFYTNFYDIMEIVAQKK